MVFQLTIQIIFYYIVVTCIDESLKLFDVKFTVFLHRFPLTLFFIVVSRLAYSCCSYVRIRTNSAFWMPTHCPNTNLNLRIKTEPVTDGADPTRYMSGNGLNTAKIIYFSIYVCIPFLTDLKDKKFF